MPKWVIDGASLDDGQDVRITLDANTPHEVIARAKQLRIAVRKIDVEQPAQTVVVQPAAPVREPVPDYQTALALEDRRRARLAAKTWGNIALVGLIMTVGCIFAPPVSGLGLIIGVVGLIGYLVAKSRA